MSPNITRKVSRETLVDEWGIPYDEGTMGPQILAIVDKGSGRWESRHSVIFVAPDDGETYSADYSVGLTEKQYQDVWEYETEITLTQVEPMQRMVTVTDWVSVKYGTGALIDPDVKLPQRVPHTGPKIPTQAELKAQWARNRDWDEAAFRTAEDDIW